MHPTEASNARGPRALVRRRPAGAGAGAGAGDRAGFIDAPLTGPAKRPQSATVAPTARAALGPTTRSRVAVPRTTVTSSQVNATSIARAGATPKRGRVAPSCATRPNVASRNAA